MMYLFDTSVIIDILRSGQSSEFIQAHAQDELITSTVCVFEIYCGIYRSEKRQIQKRLEQFSKLLDTFSTVLPIDSTQAAKAGEIHAELSKKGILIDDMDILIAASALSVQATLVTGNARHFTRVPELSVLPI